MGYSTNTTNIGNLVKTYAIKFEFSKNFILDSFLFIEILEKQISVINQYYIPSINFLLFCIEIILVSLMSEISH